MTTRPAGALVLLSLLYYNASLAASDGDAVLPSLRTRATHEQVERPAGIPSDEQLETMQARIGRIWVDPRNIFDASDPAENTKLFRLANRLHVLTRRRTIESQLLFRTGDPYQGRLLHESERILRTTDYLQDAWIRPVACRDGIA